MTNLLDSRHLGHVAAWFAAAAFCAGLVLPAAAHERPLGNMKISAEPKQGYLMSCQTRFNPNAPGARKTGPWVTGSTYDPAKKPAVSGSVTWPSEISITRDGGRRIVHTNSLPDHPTGVFPISPSDPVYQYGTNPNPIRSRDILLTLPADPVPVAEAHCVPMSMIGVALTGAVFFNAFDARGRDAAAYDMLDSCRGHPEETGQYHYHDHSGCMKDTRSQPNGHSDLVGYALDGFGIFGLYGENGKKLITSDLDSCHGHVHEVIWDDQKKSIYHYHLTDEFPYSIGCFRGAPVDTSAFMQRRRGEGPGARGSGPFRGQPGYPPPQGRRLPPPPPR